MQDYRETIRREMGRSAWTAYRLAGEAGVQRIVLNRWLSGEKSITDDTLAKLAAALGLELKSGRVAKIVRLPPQK